MGITTMTWDPWEYYSPKSPEIQELLLNLSHRPKENPLSADHMELVSTILADNEAAALYQNLSDVTNDQNYLNNEYLRKRAILIWNYRKNDNEYHSWPMWLRNVDLANKKHRRHQRPSKPQTPST